MAGEAVVVRTEDVLAGTTGTAPADTAAATAATDNANPAHSARLTIDA